MFCLEYPGRSKPHEFQQGQKCDDDHKPMAGRLEEIDEIYRFLPLQHFQDRVHPIPNRQIIRQDLHEHLAGIAINDFLQRIHIVAASELGTA